MTGNHCSIYIKENVYSALTEHLGSPLQLESLFLQSSYRPTLSPPGGIKEHPTTPDALQQSPEASD